MRKTSIIWAVVCGLMALSLAVAACGPAATTSSTSTSTTKTTTSTSVGTTTTQTSVTSTQPPAGTAKPTYGGELTLSLTSDTQNWDPGQLSDLRGFQISTQNEALMSGDWARGPAGSKETDWQYGCVGRASFSQGLLSEKWEIPDNQTLIFHIRPGIKWWNKAPANGREFTAADAAWNINNQWRPDFASGNFNLFFLPSERLISANATDKYTLTLKVPANTQGTHFWEDGQRCYMMLPELWPKQSDWKQSLGTGPFMVTDYIPNSLMTLVRNPNYWQTDPVGPGKGNQLPYIDKLSFLVIPDASTRMAAFRTGKIDILSSLVYDDFNDLTRTMKWKPGSVQTFGAVNQPIGREDKKLPFNDVRVRQAMNYAVDKVAIARDYYHGQADVMGWPYYPTPAFSDVYTPLSDMPQDVQDIVKGGNVAKAKALLTEAGYPNGFKTSIVTDTQSANVDFLAIIKDQLAQVGIDMSIKPTDPAVLGGIQQNRTWDEMFYKASKQYFLPHYMFEMRPESQDCASFWDSTQTRAVFNTIQKTLAVDDQAWRAPLKAVTPYVLQQSFAIWMPVAYKFNVWQPWVQNYYGTTTMAAFQPYHSLEYSWIDSTIRKSYLH